MLDAQKAFDVVDHDSLLRRLYLDGICGSDWMLLQNMYSDLTSVVKWEGTLSDPFVIKQGVRQGGVLSTAQYKRYNNPLLIQLENKFTGAKIGCIRIPHVTVADDLTLMSHSTKEMQVMVPTSGGFANRSRFVIHPKKSCILTYWDTYLKQHDASYIMNSVEMSQVKHSTHLGIHRDSNNKANIAEKVSLGRRTAYSLMGAGLHCGNGLKQSVCGKLWSTYVVPRLLYGLEVLYLTGKDIKALEQYQRKSLRQIQSLPDKTHNAAVLALLGILPLERVIHKNMLNLFGRWILFEGVEKDIAVRQLATKSEAEASWFNRIKQLLEMYDLPLPSQLLENAPTKIKWKKMVNKAINSVVELQWQEDISSSSTLKYINPESLKVGRAHHVWSSVRNSVHDSRRAQLKSRLLTGTYTLQSNRAVFNQFAVDPTCNLCEKSPETRQHFLAECQTLHCVRQSFCNRIQVIVDRHHIDIASPDVVTQLILDPSVYLSNKTDIDLIELYSRELISSLHRTRNKLLSSKEKQQSLAVSISKISQANFSIQQKNRKQIKKSTSNRRFAVK